jgi:LCP family protein required for cell wall assembly
MTRQFIQKPDNPNKPPSIPPSGMFKPVSKHFSSLQAKPTRGEGPSLPARQQRQTNAPIQSESLYLQRPTHLPGIPKSPDKLSSVWSLLPPHQANAALPPPPSPSIAIPARKKKQKKYIPIWARVSIALLICLVVISGGAFAYYQSEIAPALNNIIGKQAIHTNQNPLTGATPTGRTNILLLGSDTDGKGNDAQNGTPLAQTVMIITIDPQTNYVGMLSIPRDMQVTNQGYIEPKLDEVFEHSYIGNTLADKVASGAGAMEDAIEYNFGIHIDHYAWIGLSGFVKVIDTIGGIDVDIIHPMVDDAYPDDVGNTTGSIYDYKRLYISPGPQHLNGLQALDYVRTRHSDLVGDFGRTVRQQQIISQLKAKLATPEMISKATELLQDLNGAVQTDMQLNDIIGLANLARNIDTNSVKRLTLGPPEYAVANTNGQRTSNYLPVCSAIIPAVQKMFNISNPNCVSQLN